MRICLISERFHPDPFDVVSILFSQLLRTLKDNHKNLEIDVVTSGFPTNRYPYKLKGFHNWGGIKIHRINAPYTLRNCTFLRLFLGVLFSWLAFIKVFRLNRYAKYDLIITATNPPCLPLVGYLMLKCCSIPYLYIVHDLFLEMAIEMGRVEPGSVFSLVAFKCQRAWLVNAKRIVVVGRCMHKKLVELYHIPSHKITVITSWSDVGHVAPISNKTSFRRENGLDGFLVLYAGNIGYAQKLDTVIGAAAILENTHPEIRFVFVGEGMSKINLIKMANKLDLKNVLFFPSVKFNTYSEVLASADVGLVSLNGLFTGLAVPSKTYNILASGRPMIAICHHESEIARMMREFNVGICVEPDNVVSLAEEIIKLHDAGSLLLQDMGRISRETCGNHFTLQIISSQYYQLLMDIYHAENKPNYPELTSA